MYLLYPNANPDVSFRRDEMTAETLKSLGVGRLLAMEERELVPLLSADPTVIDRRQALFQDLDRSPALTEIIHRLYEYLKNIREMAQKRAGLGQTAEDVLYSFGEVSLFIGMIRDISEALEAAEPASDALKELSRLLNEIAADPQFAEIEEYVEKLAESRNVAKSITLGVNLDAGFGVKEVGVVSINDDRYTVSDLFTAIFGKKRQDGALVCMTPLVGGEKSRGLEQAVYIALNSYLLKAFVRARGVLLGYITSVISGVTPLMDELTFILRGADWMKDLHERGAVFSFPETGGHVLTLNGCWNPALFRKTDYKSIVPSDCSADEETTILLVTGANSGGKSVYLKSVGIAAAFTALGLPVCAKRAGMPLFTRILCHFPMQDSEEESRLADECRAMRDLLDRTDKGTLLMMDESFSGTAAEEGAVIAGEVLKIIRDLRAVCLYSTHLHALASAEAVERFNRGSPKLKTLSAEYRDGERTYRIVEQAAAGLSHAYEIAERFGLRYEKAKQNPA
jgi:DNA mismatch repair ATPase MutS